MRRVDRFSGPHGGIDASESPCVQRVACSTIRVVCLSCHPPCWSACTGLAARARGGKAAAVQDVLPAEHARAARGLLRMDRLRRRDAASRHRHRDAPAAAKVRSPVLCLLDRGQERSGTRFFPFRHLRVNAC
eukprot:6173683-Pleurochrysis_carterae.AAC.1